MNDYKDLKVWQEAIDLVEEIYKIINSFPKNETYALADQLKRAAVSIPSNISEGASRNTLKEYIQFLYIALGSSSEVETQLIIAERLGYVENIGSIFEQITKVRKMLNKLINTLKQKL